MKVTTPTQKTVHPEQPDRIVQILVYLVIAIGVILRIAKYLPAWSLRGDELSVVLNLVNRTMHSLLTQPLEYEQAAPVGFLALEKITLIMFGKSEYFLRFIPFLAGILSLFFYNHLLEKLMSGYGRLFALSAFAFGDYLIYYSSEIKQYSTDVLIAIVMSLLFYNFFKKKLEKRDVFILAITGVVIQLFSHPSVFILATGGLILFIQNIRDKPRLIRVAGLGSAWLIAFYALYIFLLKEQSRSEYLIEFWGNLLSYMPMPPWKDVSWFFKALDGLYFVVGGLAGSLTIILFISLLGAWSYINQGLWEWPVYMVSMVGFNMMVSGFQKYPFHGRLILYLLPFIFILLGKGIEVLTQIRPNKIVSYIILSVAMIYFLNPAASTTTTYLISKNYVRNDLKPVLAFIQNNKQNTDLIYQFHRASRAYTYYAPDYQLQDLLVIEGEDLNKKDIDKYDRELQRLPRGQRIWMLFSSVDKAWVDSEIELDERQYILQALARNGTLLTEYYGTNDASSAHLFILK